MKTPEYALELGSWPEDPPQENSDIREVAIDVAADISTWFLHVQDVTPKLRLIRMDAIKFLRDTGMSKQEIATATGISEHRINEVIKEQRARA